MSKATSKKKVRLTITPKGEQVYSKGGPVYVWKTQPLHLKFNDPVIGYEDAFAGTGYYDSLFGRSASRDSTPQDIGPWKVTPRQDGSGENVFSYAAKFAFPGIPGGILVYADKDCVPQACVLRMLYIEYGDSCGRIQSAAWINVNIPAWLVKIDGRSRVCWRDSKGYYREAVR